MSALTTLNEIRSCIPRLRNLAAPVEVMQCLADGKKLDDDTIARMWRNIGAMFRRSSVMPCPQIREAVESTDPMPPPEWASWFRALVERQDLDDWDVSALASALDRERDPFVQEMNRLPPQFWRELGFDRNTPPWLIRARLKDDANLDDLDQNDRSGVDAAGGPENYVRSCPSWLDAKMYLRDCKWIIAWPDVEWIIARIEEVANQFAGAGTIDFSVSKSMIEKEILELVGSLHPDWLPNGDPKIHPKYQQQLDAGVLHPPSQLTLDGLRQQVARAFEPLGFPNELYDDVLANLLESGCVCHRSISRIPSGYAGPTTFHYICRGVDWLDKRRNSDSEDYGPSYSKRGLESTGPNLFQKQGELWHIRFGGNQTAPVVVKDLAGLSYIHALLGKQGHRIPAEKLKLSLAGLLLRAAGSEELDCLSGPASDPILDSEGRTRFRRLVTELTAERDQAERNHDEAEKARIQTALDEVVAELSRNRTFTGFRNLTSTPADRARSSVTNAIKRAIEKLRKSDLRELADHFEETISTGFQVAYLPSTRIEWNL